MRFLIPYIDGHVMKSKITKYLSPGNACGLDFMYRSSKNSYHTCNSCAADYNFRMYE